MSANSARQVIFDKRSDYRPDELTGFALTLDGGNIFLTLADSAGLRRGGAGYSRYQAPAPVTDGRGHHVVVTVSRSNPAGSRFYINGELAGSFDATDRRGSLSNQVPLRIGMMTEPNLARRTDRFQGALDDLMLFKRTLDPGEVAQLFYRSTTKRCRELREADKGRREKPEPSS